MLKYVSRQSYTIPGKSTITINFVDPMNYYRVVNSGNVSIFGGTVTMPTRKLYDFKVPPYNAKMYAEENVRKQLYLYNDGTEEATVLLYAFRSQFEPTVLALCDAIFNDTENSVSVEIDGFTEPLPTGNNKIGKVDVASMPTEHESNIGNIVSALNTLLSAEPSIDSINLANLSLLIQAVNINYLQSQSETATPLGLTYQTTNPGEFISELAFIKNEGEDVLVIELLGTSTTYSSESGNVSILLKAGEVLNNVKCYCTGLLLSGNNVPFRLLYNTHRW